MERAIRRSREEWGEIIELQSHSGLSAKAYCEQESIGLASFYHWRKRFTLENDASTDSRAADERFIDMGSLGNCQNEEMNDGRALTITLDLGGGLRLTIRRD